jgi:hypothetical protein
MAKKNNNNTKKRNTSRRLKGGLRQKDPSLTSWQSVYKMICVPGARLSKISFSSLKGFIFRLDVPHDPDNSEFFGLNAAGTALNEPIYSLIFKFAIISTDVESLPPLVVPGDKDDYGRDAGYLDSNGRFVRGRAKETEDLDGFKTEANVQQAIYTGTLWPQGKPITISVVDFSYFNKAASDALLTQLLRMPGSLTVQAMLQYMQNNVTATRQLGMITMELVNSDFRELWSVENSDAFASDCNYALAQIFILFTKLKVMNYDCHAGNVLASRNPPAAGLEERSVLIDFGRTLNFNLANPFPEDAKKVIAAYEKVTGYKGKAGQKFARDLAEATSFSFTDLYVGGRTTEDEVIERMEIIIKFMTYVDYATNTTYFDMSRMNRPQLKTFLQYLYGPTFSEDWGTTAPNWTLTPAARSMYASIIPTIRALTTARIQQTSFTTKDGIARRVQNGEIISINQPNRYYNRSDMTLWRPLVPVAEQVMEIDSAPLLRQRPVRAAAAKAITTRQSAECKEDDPSCCDKVKGCLFGRKAKKGGKTRHRIKQNYKKRNNTRRR